MKNDFFSGQSDYYAKYRPTYPKELYEFIAGEVPGKELVWDVATGNGQAAVALSEYFKNVYATDLSENQLQNAIKKENIIYKAEHSEDSSLDDESADLITVATAVHWFDKSKFFAEATRVLKPEGILFVWSYGGCDVNEPINKVLDYFNYEFLNDYWPSGAKENWIDKYRSLQMPFPLITTPAFTARADYDMEEIMNYMYSWSAVQEYIRQKGKNPLHDIEKDLTMAWGDPNQKNEIKWHLHSKCCRKPGRVN